MANTSKWQTLLADLLKKKQAAAEAPSNPVALSPPEPSAAEKYAPMGSEPQADPTVQMPPQGWQAALLQAQQQMPQPDGPIGPTDAAPVMPEVVLDPTRSDSYAPTTRTPWQHNRMSQREGEPDPLFEKRLAASEPHGDRSWGARLKAALGGALTGPSTLPEINQRSNYGPGNAAAALGGGAIRGFLGNLLDPDAQARQWQTQKLGQLGASRKAMTDAEKAAADAEESRARAGYYDTQSEQLPIANEQKRIAADAKAAEGLLNRIIGLGQGFDPDDPNNAEVVTALRKAGRAVPKLEPGVQNVRWVYDTATNQDIGIVTDKTGKTHTLEGATYTSEGSANRTAAAERQQIQIEAQTHLRELMQNFEREMEGVRQGNRVQLKQTPGAKATGGPDATKGRIPLSQIYHQAELATPPGADAATRKRIRNAAFASAAKHGIPYDDGARPDALTTATPKAP